MKVAAVRPGDVVVDLGSGDGQLSIPLARQGAQVLGVDVSPGMTSALQSQAHRLGLNKLEAITVPVEELDLPAASADLIVSSYALHHVRDQDKGELVKDAARWLRPGGRLVIADMMFGRGGSARDREIIRQKLYVLARKGPGGWWRIVKNVVRYQLRVQECPISIEAWMELMREAGFTSITASAIVAEAGLITAQRPGPANVRDHAASSTATGPL
jgi:ubiquinone/menaquinone biosynthesis C-methylase UbiE